MASATDFVKNANSISRESFPDEADRVAAKTAAENLLLRLETPWETTFRHTWSLSTLNSALRVCVATGLFEKWKAAGGGPKTSDELAKMTGTDPPMLRRFLRHMGAMHAIEEVEAHTYKLTPWSSALAEPGFSHTIGPYLTDVQNPGCQNLPLYLKDTSYKNPVDIATSNWPHMLGNDQVFFAWLGEHPDTVETFNEVMKRYAAEKVAWTAIYPTEQLAKDAKDGRAVVVDVGGGLGHDIEKFRVLHPDLPAGSLIVEDVKAMADQARPLAKQPVQILEHDFFQPQPVKAARAYYMHMILHDWPDDKAQEILRPIAAVMEKGYSSLLLHECVVADRNPHPHTTASDLTMMMAFSAAERTADNWTQLLNGIGLKIAKIWDYPGAQESIIEAVLA